MRDLPFIGTWLRKGKLTKTFLKPGRNFSFDLADEAKEFANDNVCQRNRPPYRRIVPEPMIVEFQMYDTTLID